MSERKRKGLLVWMGMTVANSQTHTVYTIRFVWFNQRGEHVEAVRQWSGHVPGCAVHVVPAGRRKAVTVAVLQVLLSGSTWTAGSIFTHTQKILIFHQTLWKALFFCSYREHYCWVWMRGTHYSSHLLLDTDCFSLPLPPPFLLPLLSSLTTLLMCLLHVAGRDSVDPSQPDPAVTKGKLRGHAVT